MSQAEQISEQLLSLIGRWSYELDGLNLAWGRAIVSRCCKWVERLLRVCLGTVLPVAGDTGLQTSQDVTRGKPIERMPLDELVRLLVALDGPLSVALKKEHPEVGLRGHALGRHLLKVLQKLSRIRDDFAHGWVKPEDEKRTALELLSHAQSLCRSEFLKIVVALERQRARR